MHSNLLPLLGIGTPKIFSSITQFSPIHINLGVLIRNAVYPGPGVLVTTGACHKGVRNETHKCDGAYYCNEKQ